MAAGNPTRRATAAWLMAAVGTATLVLVGSASPAHAHASGELPTAELSADGDTVRIGFAAPPDDAAVIGSTLGYLPDGAMLALLGAGSPRDLPTDDEVAALSRSPELRDYLVTHVQVRQDGVDCPGDARPADDFLADGAQLTFVCPSPVEHARIRITVLHDQDPAYRTFSVDGTEQYAIHTSASPEHPWDFTGTSSGGIDPVLWGAAAVVVVGLVGTVAVVGPRRRAASKGR